MTGALDRLLGQERTWTAAQIAGALGGEGIALSAPDAPVPHGDGGALAAAGGDAGAQAGCGAGRPRRGDAGLAQKKASQGRIALGYLDECGFSPSRPVSYAWARKGERTRVPYENPQGRRYNTMAILIPEGSYAAFDRDGTSHRHFTAADLVNLLTTRPRTDVPLVMVLDNAGIHRARTVREALPRLCEHNVSLDYLPPTARN